MATDDELKQYRAKRDPAATNEPFAVTQPTSGETWGGDFVVHLHDATRRHYDVRLQVGSVLKSFAVPRGPSLDPREKRLAVQTEDHPLSYLDFEDVIPDDNYGAGPMIVWDIGRVRYLENTPEQGIPKGKLDFVLQGRKLRGRFALVETTDRIKPRPKQRQWLLLKKQDAHVVEEPGPVEKEPQSVFSGLCVEELVERPKLAQALIEQAVQLGAKPSVAGSTRYTPMLCATEGASLTDSERLYELKLDGVRVLAHRNGDSVQLNYRSGRVAGVSFPEVQRAVQTLFATKFVIDGEIVAFDEAGRPNFQRLAKRFAVTKPFEVRAAMAEVSVVLCVFDILELGDWDVTGLTLLQRKALLAQLVRGKGLIRYLDHLDANGEPLIRLCEQRGLEGVISKVKHSTYHSGARSTDWVKHKVEEEEEFVVVGWVAGSGSRSDLGALELGSYRGDTLVYRGRVGSGFSDQLLRAMKQDLSALATDAFQCIELPEEGMGQSYPLLPEWVVRVRFLQWTPEGRLRMAVMREWLQEASPERCTAAPREEIEQRALAGELEVEAPPVAPVSTRVQGSVPTKARKVVLSNTDKVFWPEEGYTKGQLLTYYEQVAPWLLPHLERRPVMLVRYPDGITGKSFYQWNVPAGTPDWVQTLTVREEERDGKDVVTFLIDSVDALLHVINLGCIPIHVLAARTPDLSCCDFLTIDFDLGEHPFSLAVRMALELRQLLADVGLLGYPKTSGQSGLHVLIPMGGLVSFDVAKGMVELLGRLLQRKFTDEATMERRVSKRGGRAYIDTGQTGRSRTIVGPYSVRAHPGGRVSTPVHWDEVHLALRPDRYTMFSVPELLRDRGDPLEGWLDVRPDLASVLGKLERWVRQ